ncbi:hypothetical protein DERP_001478 [Dermatophagoides pteronyssinus]|uniref:Uncharacterized protein n=1 Tax=Dermatophagoides pteronyssinus TaxID=6956 RepID=A0ABQ8JF31_DERPT|nr:hypothetical protein DERP_001478 [Dermatophagoides pteronyssinus]
MINKEKTLITITITHMIKQWVTYDDIVKLINTNFVEILRNRRISVHIALHDTILKLSIEKGGMKK